MQFQILSVTNDHNDDKCYHKKGSEYKLSGRKHLVNFSAKLNFLNILIMKKAIAAVEDFHTAFNLGIKQKPEANLGKAKNLLRYHLMKEENEEYLEAANSGDLVEVADALGDMLYILCGSILEHGMQHKIEEVFEEIHRSNMSKLDENAAAVYREDGKVLKGNNYFKPEIGKILEK